MGNAGLLQGKTVVMATNAVHLLHHAEHVIRLDAGKIAEQGRYERLSMKGKDSICRASLNSQAIARPADQAKDESVKTGEVEEQEAVSSGSVSWSMYASWFSASSVFHTTIFFVSCVLTAGAFVAPSYFLQAWAGMQQKHPFREWGAWTGGYVVVALLPAMFLGVGFWTIGVTCAESAGNKLHAAELKSVLSAPLSFFSQWSSGQVTNRFSQGLFHIDQTFIGALSNLSFGAAAFAGFLVSMIIPAPYLAIFAADLIGLSWAFQHLYIPTSRQLRRLEMASKSPLYSLFSETSSPSGLATVRGLKREASLIELNTVSLDLSQKPYYHLFVVRRWLQTWLLLLTTMLNVMLVLLVVVLRHSSNAGLFGVALVQATELGMILNNTVIALTEVEIAGVALERVGEFSRLEPKEDAAAVTMHDLSNINQTSTWADLRGNIKFDKVTVSYSPDMDPAVNELSFILAAGQRLGLVGCSGSGKSTALLALFRMIEMSSGKICIDDRDITEIPARWLRSQMTIVPQNPLILAATIRENLDPEGVCTDDELWVVLRTGVTLRTLSTNRRTSLMRFCFRGTLSSVLVRSSCWR